MKRPPRSRVATALCATLFAAGAASQAGAARVQTLLAELDERFERGDVRGYLAKFDPDNYGAVAMMGRRLERQMEKATTELTLSRDRARYIRSRIASEVDVAKHSDDAETRDLLRSLSYFEHPSNGYDYLLDLPDRSFNRARALRFEEAAEKRRVELEDLRKRTPEGEWTRELADVRQTLSLDPRYRR